MTSGIDRIILAVNMPPGQLMPRIVEELGRRYPGEVSVSAVWVDSATQLEAQAKATEVEAVVVDRSEMDLVSNILLRRAADVFVVSGHGVNRTIKQLTPANTHGSLRS